MIPESDSDLLDVGAPTLIDENDDSRGYLSCYRHQISGVIFHFFAWYPAEIFTGNKLPGEEWWKGQAKYSLWRCGVSMASLRKCNAVKTPLWKKCESMGMKIEDERVRI